MSRLAAMQPTAGFQSTRSVRPFQSCARCTPRTRPQAVCLPPKAGRSARDEPTQNSGDDTRRCTLLKLGSLPLFALANVSGAVNPAAAADAAAFNEYDDGPDSFSIQVPADWESGTGQVSGARFGGATGARRALAWYPKGDANVANISIVVTNVGADFTKLGSFNTPQAFGETLVNSMDRRFLGKAAWGHSADQKAGIQEATLLSAKERNSLYYIDYSLKKPGEEDLRIFQTAVALGFNGTYNRLFTVTAQCAKADMSKVGSMLTTTVESFKPPAPVT